MKIATGECWVETWRTPSAHGYMQVRFDGRLTLVHRVSYSVLVGPIPEGLQIDHICRNPACYNPAHLEPVTAQENARRGVWHRGGFCRECGVEFTDQTAYRIKTKTTVDGWYWRCIACTSAYAKRRWASRVPKIHELEEEGNR